MEPLGAPNAPALMVPPRKGNTLAWTCNPELDPVKTPRLRRGPPPLCDCDLPACMYCRAKARQRRWYHRNRQAVIEKYRAKRELKARKAWEHSVSDTEMDRRALEMLRQEGLR